VEDIYFFSQGPVGTAHSASPPQLPPQHVQSLPQLGVPPIANPPEVVPHTVTLLPPGLQWSQVRTGLLPLLMTTPMSTTEPLALSPIQVQHGIGLPTGQPAIGVPPTRDQLADDDVFLQLVRDALDSNHSRRYAGHVMQALMNCDLSGLNPAERMLILNSVKTLAQGAPTITQQDNQYNTVLQQIATYSTN
jgi:hypothetical protein